MLIHKDIIIRIIFSFIFFGITFWVLGPIFLNYLKKKIPGNYSQDNDIDAMIRRQKERFRAQYGLSGDLQENQQNTHNEPVPSPPSKEVQQIYKEAQWGGGQYLKDLQTEISKAYSYTLSDSKINSFISLCEKKNYLRFITTENRNSKVAITNFLATLLIFYLIIEEIKKKEFNVLLKISQKINTPPLELALAIQIKLLMNASLQNGLKDERIFCESLVLSQYSEDTIRASAESITSKEANLWAKSPAQFFEELSLALNYSSMLIPIPKLKNRTDFDTACAILGVEKNLPIEEVKKIYKKIALQKHPDKIVSQKLPKILERKCIERFNQIQEAYEVIMAHKK